MYSLDYDRIAVPDYLKQSMQTVRKEKLIKLQIVTVSVPQWIWCAHVGIEQSAASNLLSPLRGL